MNKIDINILKAGDIISEPVINNFGQTLIPANTEISARHINLLKMWGIESVMIGDPKAEDGTKDIQISHETKQYIELQLSKRFRWKPENEYESAIYQLSYNKMIRELSGKAQ
jgi:RNase H-fold protein (predicted Holliday junction resolvase)